MIHGRFSLERVRHFLDIRMASAEKVGQRWESPSQHMAALELVRGSFAGCKDTLRMIEPAPGDEHELQDAIDLVAEYEARLKKISHALLFAK